MLYTYIKQIVGGSITRIKRNKRDEFKHTKDMRTRQWRKGAEEGLNMGLTRWAAVLNGYLVGWCATYNFAPTLLIIIAKTNTIYNKALYIYIYIHKP